MIYRLDNFRSPQRPRDRRRSLLLTLLLIGVLVLINFSPAGAYLSRTVPLLSKPFFRASQNINQASKDFFSLFRDNRFLTEENEQLRNEITALRLQILDYQTLRKENEELKTFFGRLAPQEQPIIARVISDFWHTPFGIIIIDVGENNAGRGLKTGDRVVALDRLFIGEIAEFGRSTAKVKLISAAGQTVAVKIGEGGIAALAEGRGSGNFLITLPRNLDIKTGEMIKTTVADLILGIVEAIDIEPGSSLQKIFVRQPLNLFSLEYVAILPA